eukprot:gene19507-biopygen14568
MLKSRRSVTSQRLEATDQWFEVSVTWPRDVLPTLPAAAMHGAQHRPSAARRRRAAAAVLALSAAAAAWVRSSRWQRTSAQQRAAAVPWCNRPR